MAETILGTDGNTDVTISLWDRKQGCFVIGSTGMGKSVLFQNMIAQDMEEGLGLCVLDPTGDLIEKVINRVPLDRLDDVLLLDPLDYEYPFPLNLFDCANPLDPSMRQRTLETVMDVFAKVFGASMETPRLKDYLRNITRTFIQTGYTMTEIIPLLLMPAFREKAINQNLPDSVKLFWNSYNGLRPVDQREDSASTRSRVDGLANDDIIRCIIGQTKTLNFRQMIDTQKIILVHLYTDREELTSLLGSIIIGQLMLAALSRWDIPEKKRRQFHIYADEFSYFATPAMGILLTQARKYAIATTVATQVLVQMNETIQATVLQAGTKIVFKIQREDADRLAGEFNTEPPKKELPEPTIPANVLDYLPKHPNEAVKAFFSTYINRLQAALSKRERYERDHASGESSEISPEHDFGEDVVTYNRDTVTEVLIRIEHLLYHTQVKETVNQNDRITILSFMASLLDFVDYYQFFYRGDTALFEPHSHSIVGYNEDLTQHQLVKDLLTEFRGSDIDVMRFHLLRGKSVDDLPREEQNTYAYTYIYYKYQFNHKQYPTGMRQEAGSFKSFGNLKPRGKIVSRGDSRTGDTVRYSCRRVHNQSKPTSPIIAIEYVQFLDKKVTLQHYTLNVF